MIGGPYVGTFPARKNLHFGNETIVNIFHDDENLRSGIGNHLALIVCFLSYEKWVQRESIPSKARLTYVNLSKARSSS
jgi:hypothetical protein